MGKDTKRRPIRLLQEMRANMKTRRSEISERFDDIDVRIDSLTHMIELLSDNMGGQGNGLDALDKRVDVFEAD